MRSERSITIWNVAALAVIMVGALLTLLIDRTWLDRWAASGQRVPVSQRAAVELPAGRSVVFYESLVAVPTYSSARLHVFNGVDRGVQVEPVMDDHEFELRWSGHNGRSLWEIDVPAPGDYEIICYNTGYKADHEVPRDDRVVFAKQPGTLAEARFGQRVIRFGGGGVTLLIAASLYVGHFAALRRPKREAPMAIAAAPIIGEPLGAEDEDEWMFGDRPGA